MIYITNRETVDNFLKYTIRNTKHTVTIFSPL